jgi:uncharacterized membrane protein
MVLTDVRQRLAKLICLALIVVFSSLDPLVPSAHAARLTLIGNYPHDDDENGLGYYGYEVSEAVGLSADGKTVTGNSRWGEVQGGFVWTRTSGMIKIYDPAASLRFSYYRPTAISGNGDVVVGWMRREFLAADGQATLSDSGFRWSRINGLSELPALPGMLSDFRATVVSKDGQTIYGYGWDTQTYFNRMVRWEQGKSVEVLEFPTGSPGAEWPGVKPTDVSADGQTIAGSAGHYGSGPGFLWRNGSITWLPYLPTTYTHYPTNHPRGISLDGSVVVGHGSSNIGAEAYRWTQETGTVGLGLLPGGVAHSFAYDVSADASTIVGYAGSGIDEAYEAFIWTESTGMRAIRSIAEERGVATQDWYFQAAIAVSDDGQTVLGNGFYRQRKVAWLLELNAIPEPASAAIAVILGVAVMRFNPIALPPRRAAVAER